MLVELRVVDQRVSAVHEVLDGASVVGVAARYGVSRQTVHRWLRKYADDGVVGLVDGSPVPASCPHQMPAVIEARIIEMRHDHPGWGPRTIGHQLAREGFDPVPGKSSIYRALVRHQLITPVARRRKRADYRRWERARSMELWQMDITGGVRLADGTRPSIVTGIDDHSRFCVSALVVARATAKPTCDALSLAMRTHGIPEAILTDNGKVFTNRFGRGSGEVLFDRICRENGIRHLLTAPRSPTTTGKVERFHKTLKSEGIAGQTFTDLAAAQAAVDAWVEHYNHQRPHQGIGMVAPIRRFELAAVSQHEAVEAPPRPEPEPEAVEPLMATRRVNTHGIVSFAPRTITSRGGSLARPYGSPSRVSSFRSITAVCSSPPVRAPTIRLENALRSLGRFQVASPANAKRVVPIIRSRRRVTRSRARSTAPGRSASRPPAIASAARTSVSKSKSRSSATRSTSRSKARSSAHTRSVTTPPANTEGA